MGRASGGLDDSSRQRPSRCRRLIAAEHVGIEIDLSGPDDDAKLAVNGDGLEDVRVVANRGKYAAGLQQLSEIDLMYSAVAEGQPKPTFR